MELQEKILECKAQALRMVNPTYFEDELEILAEDLLDMLPVQVYSDEEAQEQLES